MADDWKSGDLALFVDASEPLHPIASGGFGVGVAGCRFRKGAFYTVEKVGIHREVGAAVLWLREDPSGLSAGAFRFRKVTPPEADEFDRETIALLTGKPAHLPA